MVSSNALISTLVLMFANDKIIIDGTYQKDGIYSYYYADGGEEGTIDNADYYDGAVNGMDYMSKAATIPKGRINIYSDGDFTMGGGGGNFQISGGNYNINGGGINSIQTTNANGAGINGIQSGSFGSIISYKDGSVRLIIGDEIDDVITGMTSSSSSIIGNIIIVGEGRKMIWSDNPNEIVVLEGNTCDKRVYRRHMLVSSGMMSTSDCLKVLEQIQRFQKNTGTAPEYLAHLGNHIQQTVQQSLLNHFNGGFPFQARPHRPYYSEYDYLPTGSYTPGVSFSASYGHNNYPYGYQGNQGNYQVNYQGNQGNYQVNYQGNYQGNAGRRRRQRKMAYRSSNLPNARNFY